ncbi:MAG: hypothetical protein MK240_11445, partial [Opitutales bacterium]|nr:hypothetical protein [Opitutales bacterium]
IGSDTWDSLTAIEQSLLDIVCTAGVTRNLAKAEALQGPVIEGFKSKGVEARELPIPILREMNRISDDVINEEPLRDSDFRVIHESQKKFRESYAVWKRLAYLPRDF